MFQPSSFASRLLLNQISRIKETVIIITIKICLLNLWLSFSKNLPPDLEISKHVRSNKLPVNTIIASFLFFEPMASTLNCFLVESNFTLQRENILCYCFTSFFNCLTTHLDPISVFLWSLQNKEVVPLPKLRTCSLGTRQ